MTERDSDPTRGNMIGFLNTSKVPGDARPVFQGKLTLPGVLAERGFALWATTSERSGATVLTGRAGENAVSQIDKLTKPAPDHEVDATIALAQRDGAEALEIKPHSMVLFTNKSKDAQNQSRPDYWGYYNPGGNEPLMRLAAWAKTDQRGNAMITGSLQKNEQHLEHADDPAPEADHFHNEDREQEDEPEMRHRRSNSRGR